MKYKDFILRNNADPTKLTKDVRDQIDQQMKEIEEQAKQEKMMEAK